MLDRAIVRERGDRLASRLLQVSDRRPGIVGRAGVEQVMREGGDAVEVGRAGEFERVGDAAMEQRPRGGADVVVGRLADERVGEPEGAGGARYLVNDAC